MPSKPAGNNNQTTTSQTQVQLPQWLGDLSAQTASQAKGVSDNLAQPTQLQVAGLTPSTQDTLSWLLGMQGGTTGAFGAAQNAAQGVANYQPQQVGATPGWLQGYMNPYTQSVIDPSLQLLDQSRQGALNQNADQAAKTGAFAGSRQAVADAATNSQFGLQGAQLAGTLNAANFQQAQQAAMAAQVANQQAGLQGGALNLQGALGLGNLAAGGQAANLQSAQAALGGQQLAQQTQQAQNQSAYDFANANRQQPVDQLQILLAALKGVPYGQTQTTTSNGPGATSNPALTGLGGLAAGTGILGNLMSIFGGGGAAAGALGGGLPGAAGITAAQEAIQAAGGLAILSDRRMKTDIEKLGKDPDSGLNIYAYRYKTDPKTYPKLVGPMAQEVEKKYPGSVVEVGGKKVITNLGFGGG